MTGRRRLLRARAVRVEVPSVAKEGVRRDREQLGYEEVVGRLEEVVRRLEAGNLPLEESLKAFEEGVSLVRQGEARLGEAERRIEQLLATPQGDQVAPFEGEAPPPPEAPRPGGGVRQGRPRSGRRRARGASCPGRRGRPILERPEWRR
jgi:exodeoxyribonuclease VII small subunit